MERGVIICTRVKRKNIKSSGEFETLPTDSAELRQSFEKDNAGAYWVQQLSIVLDVAPELSTDLQLTPQLFELTDSKEVVRTWGDTTHKVRCAECPRVDNATRIVFKRKTTTPLA